MRLAISIILICHSVSIYASIITQGESQSYLFNPFNFSQHTTIYNNSAQVSIMFENSFYLGGLYDPYYYTGLLESGEIMRIDFYEDAGDSNPFGSHIIEGSDSNSYSFIWTDIPGTGTEHIPWLDLEGYISISSVIGEFEIRSPLITLHSNGYVYSGNAELASVPLPPSLMLFTSSLLFLGTFTIKHINQVRTVTSEHHNVTTTHC